MSGLQEAFYIFGIIYMAIMLIIALALVAAVFVIRAKVNKIHDNLEAKINSVTNLAEKGGELAAVVSGAAVRKAKKALNRK
jgi:Flp pilus assembly pilin Flp